MTKLPFEETLIEVWRQALVENAKAVKVDGESYSEYRAALARTLAGENRRVAVWATLGREGKGAGLKD